MRLLLSISICLAAVATAAAEPPPDLMKRVAANGSRFERELDRYTYRQTFHFFEMDRRGTPVGDYLEVRDVTFNPEGERIEEFVKGPVERLKRMRLTEEDFRDLREVQPFVLTDDTLWLYEWKYQGEEERDGKLCYVIRISPRQVLEGQRLLDGRLWIDRDSLQVVEAAGQPLPQFFRTEDANLFPRFSTRYAPIDGEFWFPVQTVADDTLSFPSGLQRVRYEIGFENYRRFSADTTINFQSDGP